MDSLKALDRNFYRVLESVVELDDNGELIHHGSRPWMVDGVMKRCDTVWVNETFKTKINEARSLLKSGAAPKIPQWLENHLKRVCLALRKQKCISEAGKLERLLKKMKELDERKFVLMIRMSNQKDDAGKRVSFKKPKRIEVPPAAIRLASVG